MTDRLRFAHGLVLADPAQPAAHADLWIEGGVIREIGAPGRFDAAAATGSARRIDASARLTIAGLVNAHPAAGTGAAAMGQHFLPHDRLGGRYSMSEDTPDWLQRARSQWRWRGDARPAFAQTPGPGQASVWDYPRPPALVPDKREVIVLWNGVPVARTRHAIRLLETSHPPSFYLPWADVDRSLLVPAGGGSFCEWKGPARYWSLAHGGRRLDGIAWSYPQPLAGAEAIAESVAFYAEGLQCSVGGAPVTPQPGGFYGGWVTPELVGPFKGVPGSTGW